jgi:hypothetical protein
MSSLDLPVSQTNSRTGATADSRPWPRSVALGVGQELALVWLTVGVFVAVSIWWLMHDNRVPDYDSGAHMNAAFLYFKDFSAGHLLRPFVGFDTYPPLVRVVGALAIFLFGMHPMALVLSSNFVFVPLLALGCYGVGKVLAGPRAGLLAAVFALGSPMFVSMMHQYDLDPPQAAMVAVTVWALLASRRFERAGVSALAGVLFGLALMTKETSAIFIAGLLVALVIRGGWRQPRGLLLFEIGCLAIAGPWYAYHFGQLVQTFTSIAQLVTNSEQAPPLLSARNATWYFWDLVNEQTLAPLALAFFAGVALAVTRLVRDPSARQGFLPELLAGAAVSYVGMTLLTHKDPRYTLPALVYVAVLATFWVPSLPKVWLRRSVAGAIIAVAAVNFAAVSFGLGGIAARVMLALPGAQSFVNYPRQLTLYEDVGYVRGGPMHNGDMLGLVRGLRRDGVTSVTVDPSTNYVDLSAAGLLPMLDEYGIRLTFHLGRGADFRYVLARAVHPGDPRPCQWFTASTSVFEQDPGQRLGVYVLRRQENLGSRDRRDPLRGYVVACPGRVSVPYR